MDDRAATPYAEVPFDVASDVGSLEVRVEVSSSSSTRIDVGCRGPSGWRGWSGGARRRFVIAEDRATWGYVAGPLEPGEWAVVLGLHEVPAEGVNVRVHIDMPGGQITPDPPAPPGRRREVRPVSWPSPAGTTWYAGDFHAHTLHSDGSLSVRQLAALAAAEGLDFLAITDHNTTSHHPELLPVGNEYGILLVPGQEVTSGRGHMNAFGPIPWIDFRTHPDAWLSSVRDAGGLASLNHPVSGDCAWQWELSSPPTHAELLHVSWLADRRSAAPWAWWVNAGVRYALGGSDFHNLESGILPGRPVTWVAAEELSVEGVLSAAGRGLTSLSVAIDAPAIIWVDDAAYALRADGTIASDQTGRRRVVHGDRVRLDGFAGTIRLETPRREIVALCVQA